MLSHGISRNFRIAIVLCHNFLFFSFLFFHLFSRTHQRAWEVGTVTGSPVPAHSIVRQGYSANVPFSGSPRTWRFFSLGHIGWKGAVAASDSFKYLCAISLTKEHMELGECQCPQNTEHKLLAFQRKTFSMHRRLVRKAVLDPISVPCLFVIAVLSTRQHEIN